MSVEAMSWALNQQFVKDATARHVLLCLCNYADVNGRAAFPSVDRLSKVTGLSERTIRYKLDHLEEVGAICRGNQAVARAYIGRDDKCPVSYDVCLTRGANDDTKRGADGARGANDDSTGCKPRQHGVQMTTARGAAAAPKPSINHPLTILKPSRGKKEGSTEFEQAWSIYPRRAGGNPKADALKAWNARIAAGIPPERMLAGTMRYAAFCSATFKVGTEFVKQAATFYGPSLHFEEQWEVPPPPTSPTRAGGATQYGRMVPPDWNPEDDDLFAQRERTEV